MKTLVIVRHAKSSWDYEVSDRDRPLKERGIQDAYLVSNELKKLDLTVDAVFSSPANRALQTCTIFLNQIGVNFNKLKVTPEMYDFGGESVLHLLRSLNNNLHTVMVFGHNYALTSIANLLGDKRIDNVTTSGVVVINFKETDWNKIGKGITKNSIFPKDLR